MSGNDGVEWGPERRLQAADIARRFYLSQQTKVEIAEELGLSRFQVARSLEGAHSRGLVRIQVTAGDDLDHDASAALRRHYGLRRALVAPTEAPSDVARNAAQPGRAVARLAAALLVESARSEDVLGLAWSRTVNDMVDAVDRLPPCTVVQLCGAYALPWRRDTSAETVARAGAIAGGRSLPIYAPLLLPDRATARSLRTQPGVADAVAMFPQLTTAVVSVGAWKPTHSTVHDLLPEDRRRALADQGATAEIVGILFDASGAILDTELSSRVLAIDIDTLRAVPEVIALVKERERAGAAHAALRSGLVTTIITDRPTADALMQLG